MFVCLGLLLGVVFAVSPTRAEVHQGTVPSADGVPIAYDVRGNGPVTLVFIHCWACNRLFWRSQVDVFAERYRVVTLDLAGHGESGRSRKHWSIVGLADDVCAVAAGLNLQRMILVGHSMGGPVALEAARRLHGRVLGVVLVDTLHDVGAVRSPKSAQADAARLTSDFTGYFSNLSPLFAIDADPSIARWVEQQAITADPAAVIALKLDTPNLRPKKLFAAAGVPIRDINAEPPLSDATNVAQNRKFADYEAILIPNVGHFLQLERPEIFNEGLSRSIASITK